MAQLMTALARLGIRIEADGERLRYSPRSAMTPELLAELRARKDDVLRHLRGDALDFQEIPMGDIGPDGWPVECVEPPPNCQGCNGLNFWWTVVGGPVCSQCNPADARERLRRIVKRQKPSSGDKQEPRLIVGAGHPSKSTRQPPKEILWVPDGSTGCWNLAASNEHWQRQRE